MKEYNSIFVLFIMWCFLNITNGLQTNDGYQFIPETDGLYKLHGTPSEWGIAAETCENEGAILFHPTDEHEWNLVIRFFEPTDLINYYYFWLGVSKSQNRFKTITGVPISNTFNNWNNVQLDHDYQDCLEAVLVIVNRNQTSVLEWLIYARECSKKNVFICKMPITNQSNYINDEVLPHHHISKPGYHLVPGTNGLYKYHNIKREWETALAICNEEGATLFYPEDENELAAVIRFWQKIDNGNVPERFLLDMRKGKNGFRTLSGIPISKMFNKWRYRKPNNDHGNEHCVEIVNRYSNWALNEFTCWVTRKYICKAPIKQVDQPSTTTVGYKYSELLGKSYKLHLTPKNWNEARAVCQAEASELAVINSPEEAAHLVNLANSVNDSITENFTHGVILLGFHKQNVEYWQTVQGKSLSSMNYWQPWGKQQPDRGNGEECGAMFYNGYLTDISCSRKALFICEHVVDDLDFIVQPNIS